MRELTLGILLLFVLNGVGALSVLVLRFRNTRRAARLAAIEARWEPAIIAAIGSGGGGAPMAVPPEHARHFLTIIGRFVTRLRGPDRDAVAALAVPYVDILIEETTSRSSARRSVALSLLGIIAYEENEVTILGALDDPSEHVSLVAAAALCRPGDPRNLAEVLERLPRYLANSPPLLASILALGGTEAAPTLRSYVADETRPSSARAVAARALRILRDPLAAQATSGLLESDDPELVAACLRLINMIGTTPLAPQVRPLLTHPTPFVRAEAAAVIGTIGDGRDIDAIAGLLRDESPWVAIRAAHALVRLGASDRLLIVATEDGLHGESAREALLGTVA